MKVVLEFKEIDDIKKFAVTLQIYEDGVSTPYCDIGGELPVDKDLEGLYTSWKISYNGIKKINYRGNNDCFQVDDTVNNYSISEGNEACQNYVESFNEGFKEWLNNSNKEWQRIIARLQSVAKISFL